MPTEYDLLVRAYRRSKELAFRQYSELPNHLELLGDLRGRRVLDLTCGEGCYTRRIRQGGAGRVVGMDVSPAMIAPTAMGGPALFGRIEILRSIE